MAAVHESFKCHYESTFVNVGLVVMAIVAIVIGHETLVSDAEACPCEGGGSRAMPDTFQTSHNLMVTQNIVDYVGLLIWPVIWDLTIGYGLITHYPFAFVGFVWPMALIFFDMFFSRERMDPLIQNESHSTVVGNVQLDATAVITVSFAMGALLLSSDKTESRSQPLMYSIAMKYCWSNCP